MRHRHEPPLISAGSASLGRAEIVDRARVESQRARLTLVSAGVMLFGSRAQRSCIVNPDGAQDSLRLYSINILDPSSPASLQNLLPFTNQFGPRELSSLYQGFRFFEGYWPCRLST